MKKLFSIFTVVAILGALSVNSFAASNGKYSHALKSNIFGNKYETCKVSAQNAAGGCYSIQLELWTSDTGVRLNCDAGDCGPIRSTGKFSKSVSTKSSNAGAGHYACYIKDEYGNLVRGTYGYGWD